MWILSRGGLLSVVQAAPEPGSPRRRPRKLMIRARVRRHLELLQRDHRSLRRFAIIESAPQRDYGWRIIVPRATLVRVVAAMVADIDYGNFKARCAASPDLGPDYNAALHEVWRVFRGLQK